MSIGGCICSLHLLQQVVVAAAAAAALRPWWRAASSSTRRWRHRSSTLSFVLFSCCCCCCCWWFEFEVVSAKSRLFSYLFWRHILQFSIVLFFRCFFVFCCSLCLKLELYLGFVLWWRCLMVLEVDEIWLGFLELESLKWRLIGVKMRSFFWFFCCCVESSIGLLLYICLFDLLPLKFVNYISGFAAGGLLLWWRCLIWLTTLFGYLFCSQALKLVHGW